MQNMDSHDIDDEELNKRSIWTLRFKFLLLLLVVALVTTSFIMTTQRPNDGGPLIILSFLGVIFIGLFSLACILIEAISYIFSRRLGRQKFFYISLSWAVGGVLLIGLITLRQLQLLDVGLIMLFEVIFNFYILRRL